MTHEHHVNAARRYAWARTKSPIPAAVKGETILSVGASATGTVLEAISTSSATVGNLFRYDATGGQYIFNLNTKTLSAGTHQLRIDMGDGVQRTEYENQLTAAIAQAASSNAPRCPQFGGKAYQRTDLPHLEARKPACASAVRSARR